MIKYYEELEDRDKYYLPLIDKSKNNKIEVNCNLPISFYEKNKKLFIFSKEILNEFKMIDDNMITERYKLGIIEYDELFCISSLQNIRNEDNPFQYLETINNITAFDSYYYFSAIVKILRNFSIIFKEKQQYYKDLTKIYEELLHEIKNIITINYNPSRKIDVYLPDIWYITSQNDLYNPTGPIGSSYNHKEASLVYPYENVKKAIRNNISLEPLLINKKKELAYIEREKCITRSQFIHYLNYMYDIPTSQKITNENSNYFDEETHVRNIVQIVKGVISAEVSLYSFFLNMQKYSTNVQKEFDKLVSITSDDICDILVRCCRSHKIDSCHNRMIVTSELLYEKEFFEYIKNNWKIDFVPPIQVNRESGEIAEMNMDSPFIQRYIENNKIMKLR